MKLEPTICTFWHFTIIQLFIGTMPLPVVNNFNNTKLKNKRLKKYLKYTHEARWKKNKHQKKRNL